MLSERRHPLLLGTPRTLEWRVDLALPENAKVVRLPSNQAIKTNCMTFERTVKKERQKIVAVQRVQLLCERVPVKDYQATRRVSAQIVKVLAEEVVLKASGMRLSARVSR